MEAMQIERLGLQHKDLLFQRLRNITVPLSEYSFANLYLFREQHAYEVILDDHVFIRGRTYDGHRFLMPTEPLDRMGTQCIRDLLAEADFLFPIPEAWLAHFPPGEFEVIFREGDADYLYTVEKMSTYAGRKLHKKRNLLKQFVETYKHEAQPLTAERIGDAKSVLEAWQAESTLNPAESDYGPCREALDRYDELVLCGGIVYADGEPAGFVLGEEVNDETYVLHFAKARTRYKGVYQYLFNSFARVLPSRYRYLNLEQDLDKENLRVFKSSYVPDIMLQKARVQLRKP
ncbi:MAG: phosphatidylglycerol lysyltransferase domain-containing protein [Nitrospiraceae bacterium]|nr:phosphatidylglycerol lysyltransferase domain-containing protein [Nitrospiraceae bacterium]